MHSASIAIQIKPKAAFFAGKLRLTARFQPQSSNPNFELELLSSLSPFPGLLLSTQQRRELALAMVLDL